MLGVFIDVPDLVLVFVDLSDLLGVGHWAGCFPLLSFIGSFWEDGFCSSSPLVVVVSELEEFCGVTGSWGISCLGLFLYLHVAVLGTFGFFWLDFGLDSLGAVADLLELGPWSGCFPFCSFFGTSCLDAVCCCSSLVEVLSSEEMGGGGGSLVCSCFVLFFDLPLVGRVHFPLVWRLSFFCLHFCVSWVSERLSSLESTTCSLAFLDFEVFRGLLLYLRLFSVCDSSGLLSSSVRGLGNCLLLLVFLAGGCSPSCQAELGRVLVDVPRVLLLRDVLGPVGTSSSSSCSSHTEIC